MLQSCYLAFKYITFHRGRSLVLIFSLGIIIYLPNGLQRLIHESEAQIISRAKSTPLIVGAKGSATDLVINTLYFKQEKIESIPMKSMEQIQALGFGNAIPIACMFTVRGFPIVATDLGYFDFRKLTIASGRQLAYVGECVLGSALAERFNVSVGDSLVSDSENFIDIAGVYPLKMNVVGILNPSESHDDQAIFVDLKTNWVIMGLGHGHEDLTKNYDQNIVIERDSNEVKAGAKLFLYNSISPENMDSFHFHGELGDYPLTSFIVIPSDHKTETILMGRFASGEFDQQIVVPEDVVNTWLKSIFRIKQLFDSMFLLVGLATILILILIVTLSVRLRQHEIYTMFTIGSSRLKVVEIITLEMGMLILVSLVFAGILYSLTGIFVDHFINQFIL